VRSGYSRSAGALAGDLASPAAARLIGRRSC
jgi:hypothetical protein